MAAADGSGSLAGVRPTKGLLLFFALLSLLYVAHALEAKTHLELLTRYHQGGLTEAAKRKAQLEHKLEQYADSFERLVKALDPSVKFLKATTERFYYLRDLTTVIKDFFDEKRQELAKVVEDFKEEMEDIWAYIELQEDKRNEL